MKIFIGGSKTINVLDENVKSILNRIYKNNNTVLIGDCFGVDKIVQNYFADLKYPKVKIYVSGNKVRNNVGKWKVKNISVSSEIKGFDFYRQKDIVMANESDYGFMIWDRKSKGTLNNIIDLICKDKGITVYLNDCQIIEKIQTKNDLLELIEKCDVSIQQLFKLKFDGADNQ